MPFGLTNAPATFQSCMKIIFHEKICKFILVLFDYVVIYSKTWNEHLHHIEVLLKNIHDQSFFSMLSKYEFVLQNCFLSWARHWSRWYEVGLGENKSHY